LVDVRILIYKTEGNFHIIASPYVVVWYEMPKKKVTGISGANRGTDEESDFIHPTEYCITLFIYR